MRGADAKGSYDREFFAAKRGGSARSAERILPIVLELTGPIASLVDVGCGIGTWAHVAAWLGVDEVIGIDGDYVDRTQLCISPDRFVPHDLSTSVPLTRRFDLAISLEVAEHLPADRAGTFVRDLTRLAPMVLFSAAVPGQGGTHHVNEQWQDHWVSRFAAEGYVALDVVRPRVWEDPDVRPWYAQNTLLYVAAEALEAHPGLQRVDVTGGLPMRVVHPSILATSAAAIRSAGEHASPATRLMRRVRRLRRG